MNYSVDHHSNFSTVFNILSWRYASLVKYLSSEQRKSLQQLLVWSFLYSNSTFCKLLYSTCPKVPQPCMHAPLNPELLNVRESFLFTDLPQSLTLCRCLVTIYWISKCTSKKKIGFPDEKFFNFPLTSQLR